MENNKENIDIRTIIRLLTRFIEELQNLGGGASDPCCPATNALLTDINNGTESLNTNATNINGTLINIYNELLNKKAIDPELVCLSNDNGVTTVKGFVVFDTSSVIPTTKYYLYDGTNVTLTHTIVECSTENQDYEKVEYCFYDAAEPLYKYKRIDWFEKSNLNTPIATIWFDETQGIYIPNPSGSITLINCKNKNEIIPHSLVCLQRPKGNNYVGYDILANQMLCPNGDVYLYEFQGAFGQLTLSTPTIISDVTTIQNFINSDLIPALGLNIGDIIYTYNNDGSITIWYKDTITLFPINFVIGDNITSCDEIEPSQETLNPFPNPQGFDYFELQLIKEKTSLGEIIDIFYTIGLNPTIFTVLPTDIISPGSCELKKLITQCTSTEELPIEEEIAINLEYNGNLSSILEDNFEDISLQLDPLLISDNDLNTVSTVNASIAPSYQGETNSRLIFPSCITNINQIIRCYATLDYKIIDGNIQQPEVPDTFLGIIFSNNNISLIDTLIFGTNVVVIPTGTGLNIDGTLTAECIPSDIIDLNDVWINLMLFDSIVEIKEFHVYIEYVCPTEITKKHIPVKIECSAESPVHVTQVNPTNLTLVESLLQTLVNRNYNNHNAVIFDGLTDYNYGISTGQVHSYSLKVKGNGATITINGTTISLDNPDVFEEIFTELNSQQILIFIPTGTTATLVYHF